MSPEIDQVNSRCQWQPFKLVQIWSTLLFLLIVVIAKQDNILLPVKKKLAKHYNPSLKEVTLALFEADLQMTCKKQAFVAHMDWVLTQHALGKNENMNIWLFCQHSIYVKIKSTFLFSNLSLLAL